MIPVVLASKVLKVLHQECSHLDDTLSHTLDLTQPLLVQAGVSEDLGGNASTVDWGIGVHRSNQNLDLGIDTLLLLGRVANHREGTDTLTIETHVLGKALSKDKLMTLLNEQTNRVGILVGVTTGEALVGHVEEWEVLFLLDHIADLLPLLRSWVDAGGVVSASMKQNHTLARSSFEISNHAIKVKTDGVLIVVLVLLDLEATVEEDRLVVGPSLGVGM